MREQVDLLRNHKTEIRVRCILLNSEFVDTLTLNIVFGKEKTKEISEDESRQAHEEIQKITDRVIEKIDQILALKEKEILEG